ncbi:MAG: tetratricopeptide repeat protein [Deltaproteobacteria bacterium]|nr:tetratricopeptide repeat protein [Deltaproteobacteria bacterium]
MARRGPSAVHSASASSSGPSRWPPAWGGLALLLLTLVAYAPAFRAGFVWDDDDYVTDNAALEDLGGLVRIWLEPGATPQYYPLTFTSFWIERRIFGDAPLGYHATNVALHGLNAVLAWRVLAALGLPGAWLAAAVFALHPVHVESVAWITERKNVLSGACYLAALLAALGLADAPPASGPDAGARRRRALVVLAAFGAALLAKTVTCTLPVILLLLVWWRRGRVEGRDLRAVAPLLALGLALALVTVWMERTHVGARGVAWDLSFAERVLIAGRALWFYAATLAWPHPLAFVYPRWAIDAAAFRPWLFPLAAAAVAGGAWTARGRVGRAPAAALAGFAVTLAPALGFVDVYPMRYTFVADHYQYLASLFLIAPAAALAAPRAARPGAGPALAAVALLALLAALTWRRAETFRDPETLWRDVMAKNPGASMAPINLGMWLHRRGRSEEAAAMLTAALRLDPDDAEVEGDLGIVLAALGRGAEARIHLERAVALAPESPQARNNLANALAGDGRLDEAVAHYRRAVALAPGYADAQNNLANVLAQQGAVDEAVRHYEAALAADPRYAAAHANLAAVLTRLGRNDAAIAHYRDALRLDPRQPDAARGLGAQLAARGAWDEAIEHLASAARLRPQEVRTQHQLAAALAGAGRIDEAIAAYARALELQPDSADLHNDLGIAFARRGDLDAAIAEFRRAGALAPEHAEARNNLAAAERARDHASGPAAAP